MGERHKKATHSCRFSVCCLISDFCPWNGLDGGESPKILLRRGMKSSSLFSTLKCLVTQREKKWKFPLRKQNLLDRFPSLPLILRDVQDSIFCVHYRACWSLFDPVLASGCNSDLNGTGQGYVQSVCSLHYAMMRWLLRSLMSAGGTSSFFTGVGNRVERLPLGLNKSDTKNTCGGNRSKPWIAQSLQSGTFKIRINAGTVTINNVEICLGGDEFLQIKLNEYDYILYECLRPLTN